jgi:hypothetical protein
MLCDHMELYVSRFLPEGDTEIEEGTFETKLEPAQAEAELLKRGFIKDQEFDALFCRKGD